MRSLIVLELNDQPTLIPGLANFIGFVFPKCIDKERVNLLSGYTSTKKTDATGISFLKDMIVDWQADVAIPFPATFHLFHNNHCITSSHIVPAEKQFITQGKGSCCAWGRIPIKKNDYIKIAIRPEGEVPQELGLTSVFFTMGGVDETQVDDSGGGSSPFAGRPLC